jgi:GntR family transcriptional regulator
MILVVDPHSGIPVYRQLMQQVQFHISSGLLNPGDEIPSTRALSAKLGVNPMTVSKAYALLEEEGVLERRPGLPSIVRERQSDQHHASRIGQLESALRPIATKARQLGLKSDESVAVFRRLLDEDER